MGTKLNSDAEAMMQRLGFTAAEVAFTIDTSLPFLIEETQKRIRYMPYELDKAVILSMPNNVAFDVLRNLCQDRITTLGNELPVVTGYHGISDRYNTVIVPSAIALLPPDSQIFIRESMQPAERMPLYLDKGVRGYKHVYPMFDWAKIQLWAFVVKYLMKGCEDADS